MKECGICGSKKNLVGPYCGGPFVYYCASCKKVIDAFINGQERHRQFMENLRKNRVPEDSPRPDTYRKEQQT